MNDDFVNDEDEDEEADARPEDAPKNHGGDVFHRREEAQDEGPAKEVGQQEDEKTIEEILFHWLIEMATFLPTYWRIFTPAIVKSLREA